MGYFQELEDASTYKWNGRDSNGLSLWLRLKGSVRCENYHQKMESAIGSWIVGAEMAHYILLVLTYRYNCKASVQRYNGMNFMHHEHHLIDRIQIKIQQLFNVVIHKNHVNASLMKLDPNFIAVGIGPLHYSSDYVASGAPNDKLKSDLCFIAKMMNIECPPLPMSHPHEKKLFNDFYRNNPHATDATRKELAKLFLSKTNHTTIFPKLPSMMKNYETKWKKATLIRVATKQMSTEYERLLAAISEPIDFIPSDGTSSNNMEIVNDVRQQSATELQATHPSLSTPSTDDTNMPDVNEFTSNATASTSRKNRKCANFPLCSSLAKDCNGWKSSTCTFYMSNAFELPDQTTLSRLKMDHKREVDRNNKREKRRRNVNSDR